jgi:hypothetical protein
LERPVDAGNSDHGSNDQNDVLGHLLLGAVIEVDVPELGATGKATILEIGACPEIEPDDGHGRRLITSTFAHSAADVFDLTLVESSTPVGVTGNHPVFSVDDDKFVPAETLRSGTRVRLADSSVGHIASVVSRGTIERVYNIEVDGQHVYNVGQQGILVHNLCLHELAHNAFGGIFAKMTGTKMRYITDRTASGLRGVDLSIDGGVKYAGKFFKHAELKPATQSGLNTFIGQLRNWRANGTHSGPVGLFVYDPSASTPIITFFGVF